MFQFVDDRLKLRSPIPADLVSQVNELLQEWVDYRLSRYLDVTEARAGQWRLRLSQAEGRPLVWLDRPRNRGLPEGEVPLTIDGQRYVGLFRKIALNKVQAASSNENLLPDILRRWFGPEAGRAGLHSMWYETRSRRLGDDAVQGRWHGGISGS